MIPELNLFAGICKNPLHREQAALGLRLRPSAEERITQDKRGVGDLISEALPFGRLWYKGTKAIGQAIGYAKFWSRSHDAIFNKSQRVVRNPFFPSQAPSHPIYPSPSPRPHTRQQFRPSLAQGAFEREGVDKPDTQ